MKNTLWGPGLWHIMFTAAWSCDRDDMEALRMVLLEHIPMLLPCRQCRENYTRHRNVLARRLGEPKTPEGAFEWLYYLKDEVNKSPSIRARSIPLDELRARFEFSGGRADDVLIADTMLIVALRMDPIDEPAFVELCRHLTRLLPLPCDSELLRCLRRARRPAVTHAYRMCRNTRIEHGIGCLSLRRARQLVL